MEITNHTFNRATLFDYVSVTAREKVYSAAIAWILGIHSPFTLEYRSKVIRDTFGIDFTGIHTINSHTEWNKIDIVIEIQYANNQKHLIAIETKIKSRQGKSQLEIYDKALGSVGCGVTKIYLTLLEDRPISGHGWQNITLDKFVHAATRHSETIHPSANEALAGLTNLYELLSLIETDQDIVDFAFSKTNNTADSTAKCYITDLKLKSLLQRQWMQKLISDAAPAKYWHSEVSETRGNALVDIYTIQGKPLSYKIGLQLQNRSIKAFCVPEPYPEKASDEQNVHVEKTLELLSEKFGLPENVKISTSRGRGFRSITIVRLPELMNRDAWAEEFKNCLIKLQNALGLE